MSRRWSASSWAWAHLKSASGRLEALYRSEGEKDLEILGFPCNQFRGQEPGTDEEIQDFCSTTYDVRRHVPGAGEGRRQRGGGHPALRLPVAGGSGGLGPSVRGVLHRDQRDQPAGRPGGREV